MSLGKLTASISISALMALALGCGGDSDSETQGNQVGQGTRATGDLLETNGIKQGGTLRVGFSGPIVELDPQKSQSLQDQQQLENIYRSLTRPKSPDDPTPVGDIAEDWTVSDDQLTWTFKLRDGLTFHSGKPLTAADVKYSIDRIRNPKTVASAQSDLEPVKEVEVVDDLTVRMHLDRPYSILPVALGLPAWAAIIPRDSGDTIGKTPDGSGPFQYDSQVRNTSLTLTRFPDYWEADLPHVDKLVFTYLPDENARVNALRTGQVDFVDSVPLAQTAVLQKDDEVSVVKFDSSWVDELGLNTKAGPLRAREVRQAVAHALNRAEIAKVATFGLGGPAATMVAPTSPVKVEAEALGYDPERAKQLLEEAGHGDGFPMSFAPCGGDSFAQMRRAAQVIARQLKEVGIDAKAESLEAGVWAEQVITKRDFDAFVCGLVNGNDPDGHTFRYFSSDGTANFSSYKGPPELDKLLLEGREVADPDERSRIYEEAWAIINRDVPWIPLYEVPGVVAARKGVRGYQPYPEFNLRLETVGFSG